MTDTNRYPLVSATACEPSAFARATAFNILTRHPECLRDDVVLNELIDAVAAAIDAGRPPDWPVLHKFLATEIKAAQERGNDLASHLTSALKAREASR